MPVGNIAPRTDVLTLASMKLGTEEFPSTVQQAECGNMGFLLYSPKICHSWNTGTAATSGLGTTKTTIGNIFLIAGKFDFNLKMTSDITSGVGGYAWLEVGNVHVSSDLAVTAGTTLIEAFAGATLTAGWNTVQCVCSNYAEIYTVNSFSKQYE